MRVEKSLFVKHKSSNITHENCSYFGRPNSTSSFGIIRSYEGIPENLLVNFIVSQV